MARSDKRYMVYPGARAVEIIGSTSPSLNQALECWAAALSRASADNNRDFSRAYVDDIAKEFHPLHDWAVLADAIKGKPFDPDFARPGDLLAAAVEDAHLFENVGCRWFNPELYGNMPSKKFAETIGDAISTLAGKLRSLDYSRAWAIIVAVQWFWDHHEKIKAQDEWWTLAFRRQWKPEQSGAKNSPEGTSHEKHRRSKKNDPTKGK